MFEEGVGRGDKTCGSADRFESCLSMTFIATTLPPDDQERQQGCANGLDSGDLPQTSISLYKMPDTSLAERSWKSLDNEHALSWKIYNSPPCLSYLRRKYGARQAS
jgi:hypothetical protein